MVEFDTSKIGYSLKLDGKYYNTLDIEGFSHMMKDPSYCYKFYWLEAIVQLIAEGIKETTFYAVTVYYGAVGVKKTRHTIPAALCADLTCFLLSALTVRLLMGG